MDPNFENIEYNRKLNCNNPHVPKTVVNYDY